VRFFINIIYGSKQGITAGIKIAFGHTMVEFPLVIALALGLFTFSHVILNNENLKIISIIGGIAIIVFAFTQKLRMINKRHMSELATKKDQFYYELYLAL
jgi:threonine/homoserine/homoserine lactone efflux protein